MDNSSDPWAPGGELLEQLKSYLGVLPPPLQGLHIVEQAIAEIERLQAKYAKLERTVELLTKARSLNALAEVRAVWATPIPHTDKAAAVADSVIRQVQRLHLQQLGRAPRLTLRGEDLGEVKPLHVPEGEPMSEQLDALLIAQAQFAARATTLVQADAVARATEPVHQADPVSDFFALVDSLVEHWTGLYARVAREPAGDWSARIRTRPGSQVVIGYGDTREEACAECIMIWGSREHD